MKAMNSTIVRIVVIALIAMLPMVVSAVTYNNRYNEQEAVVPAAAFQSTSVLVGSGSGLVSSPKLNTDGTVNMDAFIAGQSASAHEHPGRPKTIAPVDPKTPPNIPLGDGLFALLLLAIGYALVRTRKWI